MAVALAAAAILALRAGLGPVQLGPAHINSPFTAETILWTAFVILLALARSSSPASGSNLSPRFALAISLCVVGAAFLRNLPDPFLSDDYIIIASPHFSFSTFIASLSRAGGDGAFRPFGTLYCQLMVVLADADPLRWHTVGLALHLMNTSLVFGLAWRFFRDARGASVAAMLFGLHGTRPESAVWTAGNFDSLAAACVLGAALIALSEAIQGRVVIASLLVGIGVLFKESAYAAPLIFAALAMAIRAVDRPAASRLFRAAAGSGAVCALLLVWRWTIFHGPGGYVDPGTGRPAILALHPLSALKALFIRVPAILMVPVNFEAPHSWWLPFSIVLSAGGAVWLAARPGKFGGVRWWLLAASLCAVLPAIHLALIGESILGSRVLYLAGAPFALLAGSLAADNRILPATLLIIGMTGILEHNLGAWHETAMTARSACEGHSGDTGQPPAVLNGVFFFQNGWQQCVAQARARRL